MQTFNSFSELVAGSTVLRSDMSVFNGVKETYARLVAEGGGEGKQPLDLYGIDHIVAEFIADIEEKYGAFNGRTLKLAAESVGVYLPERFDNAPNWHEAARDMRLAAERQRERTGWDDDDLIENEKIDNHVDEVRVENANTPGLKKKEVELNLGMYRFDEPTKKLVDELMSQSQDYFASRMDKDSFDILREFAKSKGVISDKP